MSDSDKAIYIGKSRIDERNGEAMLVSDIRINGEHKEMFFGVSPEYKEDLTIHRADPFLATLINYAMRSERSIVCEDPVSEELLFNIRNLYIKTLSFGSEAFHPIVIEASTADALYPIKRAVGSAMSFGCDSMYTYSKHGRESEYPITHLCNFNNGVYFSRWSFEHHSAILSKFASERGLKTVSVDTNIFELLPERFLDVYSQRNMACVLALQGLFGVYLYSSGHDEQNISVSDENSAKYDIVSVETFSTRGMQFILSGCECTRVEKLRSLCDFEDAQNHLHPCYKAPIGERNCGNCKKELRDMTLLYAWGMTEKFSRVYDFSQFERKLPMNLAILLSMPNDHLSREALDEYVRCGKQIPPKSYVYAEMYRKALDSANMKL